jgi:hypothetical protein
MSCRATAVAATYTGRLEEAVDLYRGVVEENAYYKGILLNMADGLLGAKQTFSQGTPEQREALDDANGTAGDDAIMHPAKECRQLISDMTGFGMALGQYLLTCWRCRNTGPVAFDVCASQDGTRRWEVCRRCDAMRFDRPPTVRELFALHHRDLRWVWQNTYTKQWYFVARNGLFPINSGDGEWALFSVVPSEDSWRYGNWLAATIPGIFGRDAAYDRQGVSATSAPIHVFQAKGPTNKESREEAWRQAEELAFQNKIVLPGEWIHEIHEAANRYADVATGILEWATGAFEVLITGTRMALEAKSAFADASVWARTTSERKGFIAGSWARQKREFGWTYWGLDNYGTRDVPVSHYVVKSPQDKRAEVDFLQALGTGIKTLNDGLRDVGKKPSSSWIDETCAQYGIRVEDIAPAMPPLISAQRPRRGARYA